MKYIEIIIEYINYSIIIKYSLLFIIFHFSKLIAGFALLKGVGQLNEWNSITKQ